MKKLSLFFAILIFGLLSCTNEKPIPEGALAQGKEFALQAKKALGGQLTSALAEGGTIYALEYCNLEASGITDKVSKETGIKISRASDLNRNPDNGPTDDQMAYIQKTKQFIAQGNSPEPEIKRLNNKLVGYYPIMTNGMCLQCHGNPGKELLAATESKIKELYPADKATGYGANELRGIWVIEMTDDLFNE